MPIYRFKCEECSEEFDCLIGMTTEADDVKCKKCGSKNVSKLLAGFSIGLSTSSDRIKTKTGSSCSSCSASNCSSCSG